MNNAKSVKLVCDQKHDKTMWTEAQRRKLFGYLAYFIIRENVYPRTASDLAAEAYTLDLEAERGEAIAKAKTKYALQVAEAMPTRMPSDTSRTQFFAHEKIGSHVHEHNVIVPHRFLELRKLKNELFKPMSSWSVDELLAFQEETNKRRQAVISEIARRESETEKLKAAVK